MNKAISCHLFKILYVICVVAIDIVPRCRRGKVCDEKLFKLILCKKLFSWRFEKSVSIEIHWKISCLTHKICNLMGF